MLINQDRYLHIEGVNETACLIGGHHNLDLNKLCLAAFLHDIAKGYTLGELLEYCHTRNVVLDNYEKTSHGLLHSKVGRIMAEELFHIDDEHVLNAITSHTTGRIGMSPYEEVLYVSDYTEPSRKLHGTKKIIEIALTNLPNAVFQVISQKLIFVVENGKTIHPKSIEVYNHYQALAEN